MSRAPVPPAGPTAGPSAFLDGPGHVIRHGTPAFLQAYGADCVGQPAREAMADLPGSAFELMDRVFRDGRPLARRILVGDGERRLVVAPRTDAETGDTYGVVVHLRDATR